MLDLTLPNDAPARLRHSLDRCRNSAHAADTALTHTIRTAAIKGFEIDNELSRRTLRRHLKLVDMVTPDVLTYRDMLRLAAERGLIADPGGWFLFRDLRNRASLERVNPCT